MAASDKYDDDRLWSPETCKLSDIVPEIPTLVRVTEGIYSLNDAGTFSQGDLIKIDTCQSLKRVTAYLTKPGSDSSYERHGEEIGLPYQYNGKVKVQPLHGVHHRYKSVEELINYFPRHVRVLTQVSFKEPSGTPQTLSVGDSLELKAVRRSKTHGLNSVRCARNGDDVILPKSVKGVFQVQADDTEQTIKNVVDTYKLPQCVKFIDSGVQEIMSTDIKEAIDNLQSYSGEMLLTGVKDTAPVLFGHYKGMTGDPNSKFCRRSAVVIPLDNPEISEIEVQTPEYMDSDDYQLFVLQNFSESAVTPDFVEGTLYVDFLRTTQVQFLELSEPKSSSSPDGPPPPVPPRLKSTHGVAPGAHTPEAPKPLRSAPVTPHSKEPPLPSLLSKTTAVSRPFKAVPPSSPTKPVAPQSVAPQPRKPAAIQPSRRPDPKGKPGVHFQDTSETELSASIAEAFSGMTWGDTPDQPMPSKEVLLPLLRKFPSVFNKRKSSGKIEALEVADDKSKLQKTWNKMKNLGRKMKTAVGDDVVHKDEAAGDDDDSDGPDYDYIDDDTRREYIKEIEKPNRAKEQTKLKGVFSASAKPVQRVLPSARKDPAPDEEAKDFKSLSISELECLLQTCGMQDLAKVCRQENLDGCLLCSFSDKLLKAKPFKLDNYRLQKLNSIKSGWRPKT
ncbi:uncharacterized protein LOC124254989 isoform X2 [Haliotis rubra]|uniref:uncharacterized protein LOC124254989 isoform X2 n=1 Tax=Haliotis rubra TaxID=36100 RepID=UPI001EE5E51C|nr:uncharacterized protein LOC124254989 isoform X2 [Haliotis rubra]